VSNDTQAFIRRISVLNGLDSAGSSVQWSRHAITALVEDGLVRSQVELALTQCEVIEVYPHQNRHLPDCLVLAFLVDRRPLHAVIAVDRPNERLFVVTVYVPLEERWEDDWKTRK